MGNNYVSAPLLPKTGKVLAYADNIYGTKNGVSTSLQSIIDDGVKANEVKVTVGNKETTVQEVLKNGIPSESLTKEFLEQNYLTIDEFNRLYSQGLNENEVDMKLASYLSREDGVSKFICVDDKVSVITTHELKEDGTLYDVEIGLVRETDLDVAKAELNVADDGIKADIAQFKGDFNVVIDGVVADLRATESALKADDDEIKADVAQFKADTSDTFDKFAGKLDEDVETLRTERLDAKKWHYVGGITPETIPYNANNYNGKTYSISIDEMKEPYGKELFVRLHFADGVKSSSPIYPVEFANELIAVKVSGINYINAYYDSVINIKVTDTKFEITPTVLSTIGISHIGLYTR